MYNSASDAAFIADALRLMARQQFSRVAQRAMRGASRDECSSLIDDAFRAVELAATHDEASVGLGGPGRKLAKPR